MTIAQEEQSLEIYRNEIRDGLRMGTEAGYQELAALCMEERYTLLAARDRELFLFGKVMAIWMREHAAGYAKEETIIGRTGIFCGQPREELTAGQLAEIYTFLKFSLFRLLSDLPFADQMEGVARVLALGLSPVAVLYAAEMETSDKDKAVALFISMLEKREIVAMYPYARRLSVVLRGVTERTK